MKFIIHPLEGIEFPDRRIAKFGMSREEVRKYFSGLPKEFYKSTKSKVATDAFHYCSTHIYYDETDKVEAFEVSEPTEMLFGGINLFSLEMADKIKTFLESMGGEAKTRGGCCFSFANLGISVYSPDPETEKVQAIMVAKKGYLK